MRAQKNNHRSPKMPKAITMIITLIGAPGLLGLPTTDAERDEKPLAQKAHPDERPPSNDAPTSRSLMFATGPQKMTYSSDGKETPSTSGKPAWLGYTKPITKLFLVGYGDNGPSKGCQDRYGELVSTADLNQRAGGRYIYLCASRRPFGRGSAPAVTDVRIQTSSSCPAGWKSPEKFDGLNGDLNQGAGGKDIFMCYRTGGGSGLDPEPGDLLSVAVVTGKNAACPSGFDAKDGSYTSFEKLRPHYGALDGLNGDLNQNAGGDDIYLCKAPYWPPVQKNGKKNDDRDESYSYGFSSSRFFESYDL